MRLYGDEGIVLRTIRLGEADRIVTFLTPGHGRVRAVAKGVRKTKSKFGSRLEPTSRVALQCYRGRDLDVVTQVETLEAHRALREDYALVLHALPMLEAIDQISPEREPHPGRYRMLTGALRALAEQRSPVVAPAFFWKLLSLEGFHPLLDACARCGADGGETALVGFDLDDGGTLCDACRRDGGRPLSPEALGLLRRILGGGLAAALGEPDGAPLREVERLGVSALEHHSERRLRSAALL